MVPDPQSPSGGPGVPASELVRFHAVDRAETQRPSRDNHLRYVATALRANIVELIEGLRLQPGDDVLDYGCAHQPYRDVLPPGVHYEGADIVGNPDATVRVDDDGTLDVGDASQDAVLSTQVLEHVTDPQVYLAECARVLRPGGRLLLTTHGLMVYHPDPVDLWRWTCAGLQQIVRDAGFDIVHFRGIVGPAAVGAQMVQDAMLGRVPRRLWPAYLTVTQGVVGYLDRRQSQARRDHDALVFALVARRSVSPAGLRTPGPARPVQDGPAPS